MRKIIVLVLISLTAVLLISSCAGRTERVAGDCREGEYLFLVAGFDDAAENTDVLFTVLIDSDEKAVRVAQIPRDTYFEFGGSQNKINQYFSFLCSGGEERYAALEKASSAIGEALGVSFDGFIGITTEGFCQIIDSLDGVCVYMPEDLEISLDDGTSVSLKRGDNHIGGREAEAFVRYRSGYLTADLGRMDAQKILLSALFNRVLSGINLKTVLSVSGILSDTALTNIKFTQVAAIIFDNILKSGDYTINLVTLPGEPLQSESGLSYYVLNKKCGAEVAKKYMKAKLPFDKNRQFCKGGSSSFKNAYEDEYAFYREYTKEDLVNIKIPKKTLTE